MLKLETMKQLLFIFLLLSACTQVDHDAKRMANEKYNEAKSKFARTDIVHFPETIVADSSKFITLLDRNNNNVGLLLYEFGLSNAELDSILMNISKLKILAKYSSSDTCLLVLNALPKDLCLDDPKYEAMLHQYLNKQCLKNQLPIPKFEDYKTNNQIDIRNNLGDGFDIIVLDARHGVFNNLISIPDMRMPGEWENGISRGIAFNREKKDVIYWSVMW